MKTDPKTNKVTYSDPAATEAYLDKVAQAMVDGLNKKVLEDTIGPSTPESSLPLSR